MDGMNSSSSKNINNKTNISTKIPTTKADKEEDTKPTITTATPTDDISPPTRLNNASGDASRIRGMDSPSTKKNQYLQ